MTRKIKKPRRNLKLRKGKLNVSKGNHKRYTKMLPRKPDTIEYIGYILLLIFMAAACGACAKILFAIDFINLFQ